MSDGSKETLSEMKIIKNLVVHHRPHLDEIVGLWLLERFGEDIFPGVKKAEIVFLRKELKHTYPDDLYIGIGEGEFDEHRSDGRLQNTCAAMLVARRIRVCDKEGVHELLGEVLWCDTKPKTFPTQLANLVKTMHRVNGGEEELHTYFWASAALDAIVFRADSAAAGFDIKAEWGKFLEDRKVNPELPSAKMAKKLIDGAKYPQGYLRHRAFAHSSMHYDSVRYRWLGETFAMLLEDARMYVLALAELKAKSSSFDVQTSSGIEPAYFVQSDSEHVAKAAAAIESGNATVLVVRRSSGHIQILGNPKRELSFSRRSRLDGPHGGIQGKNGQTSFGPRNPRVRVRYRRFRNRICRFRICFSTDP